MTKNITVEIVSADESIYNGKGTIITATAVTGEIGIMPGHTPLLAALKPGYISIKQENGTYDSIFISGGFIEVLPTKVTILADTAERAEDIDKIAAKEAMEQARIKLRSATGVDYKKAQESLAEASARIKLITKLK